MHTIVFHKEYDDRNDKDDISLYKREIDFISLCWSVHHSTVVSLEIVYIYHKGYIKSSNTCAWS